MVTGAVSFAVVLLAAPGAAQGPARARLADPHTMVMASQTREAGEFDVQWAQKWEPDSLPPRLVRRPWPPRLPQRYGLGSQEEYGSDVYVPQRCVGAPRCALLVVVSEVWKPMLYASAERYGIVLMAGEGHQHASDNGKRDRGLDRLDAALRVVFRTFAIDPDRVAVMGEEPSDFLARNNPDIFSRLVRLNSASFNVPLMDPVHPTTEVLLMGGLGEGLEKAVQTQLMRNEGRPAKTVLGFKGHYQQQETYDFAMRWLHESWTIPDLAARPAPRTVGPLPLLTDSVLTRIHGFWARFLELPDSIQTTARRAHVGEVILPVGAVPTWLRSAGDPPVSVYMTNMPALAAGYSAVAAALQAEGFTAEQHDAYRIALASALYVVVGQQRAEKNLDRNQRLPRPTVLPFSVWAPVLNRIVMNRALLAPHGLQMVAQSLAADSVLTRNVEFMRAHPDEIRVGTLGHGIWKAGVWHTP